MVKDELNKVEKLGIRPFTRFCMSIGAVPSSYIAGLTIEEQLLWLCSYLEKEVIPTVNNNGEAVEELQDLFVELKNYVDNYFDNLDVQEEINNKLDEMADAGTLEEIMTDYLQTKAVFGFNNVEELKNATNLINGSFARTFGYHAYNDGGGSFYKIRTITNEDIVNDKDIIALINDNTLVAELIYTNSINVEQFGAYGDNTHDDSEAIQYAINNTNIHKIKFNKNYLISDEITITRGNLIIEGNKSTITQNDSSKSIFVIDCPYQVVVNNLDIHDFKIQWSKNPSADTYGIYLTQTSEEHDNYGLYNSNFSNITINSPYYGIGINQNNPAWNIHFNNIIISSCAYQAVNINGGFDLFLDLLVIGESENEGVTRTHCLKLNGGCICENLDIEDWKNGNIVLSNQSFYPVVINNIHLERCQTSANYTGFINFAATPGAIKEMMVYNCTQTGTANGIIQFAGTSAQTGNPCTIQVENLRVNNCTFNDTYVFVGSGDYTNMISVDHMSGFDETKILYPYVTATLRDNCYYRYQKIYVAVARTLPSGVTMSNTAAFVKRNERFYSAFTGLTTQTVKVTMLGVDITSQVYNASTKVINIPVVYGNLTVTVS